MANSSLSGAFPAFCSESQVLANPSEAGYPRVLWNVCRAGGSDLQTGALSAELLARSGQGGAMGASATGWFTQEIYLFLISM